MNSARHYSSPELDPLKTRCLPDSVCMHFPESLAEWDSQIRSQWHSVAEQHKSFSDTLHWLVEAHAGIALIGALLMIVFWRSFKIFPITSTWKIPLNAFVLLLGTGLCDLFSSWLKVYFGRLKPHVAFYNPHVLPALSFPSNHAANTSFICLWLFLATLGLPERFSGSRKVFAASLVSLILFIDLSRVVLGEHYPLDAVAGTLFGLSWAALYWGLVKLVRSTKP